MAFKIFIWASISSVLQLHIKFMVMLMCCHKTESKDISPQMKILNKVKPVLSGHSKRRPKLDFKTDVRLMQVKGIAECSKRAFCNTFDLH